MKTIDKKSLLIVLGVVVSILAMETVPQDLYGVDPSETVTHSDGEGEDQATIKTKSDFALPLSLEFEIDPVLQLLNIIPENEQENASNNVFEEFIIAQQKVFKVLFRQIISPNAP